MFKRTNYKKVMAVTIMVVAAFFLVACEEETTQYTITLDPGQGQLSEEDQQITAPQDASLTLPVPEREHHHFKGWYTDMDHTNAFDQEAMPAEDMTVFAKWEKYPELTFNTHGGEAIEPVVKQEGSELEAPEDVYRKGYDFVGWYEDAEFENQYAFDTMPAQDLVLHAKWEIKEFNIDYNLNGGSNHSSNVHTYTVEDLVTLHEPSKEGHMFLGWYQTSGYEGEPLTQIEKGTTGDISLHAAWATLEGDFTLSYHVFPSGYDASKHDLLNDEETFEKVMLGWLYSSAFTSEGHLFTWGSNEYGQLADGTFEDVGSPQDITENFDLNEEETLVKVSIGSTHASAITSENRLFTWGRNRYGEIGDGTTVDYAIPTDITDKFDLVEEEKLEEVSLGLSVSSALTSDGRVFTWGYNEYGNLGDGTTTNRHTPTDITDNFNLNEGETIKNIYNGSLHSSALTSEGRLFTWGWNTYGQLGDGSTINRNIPINITPSFDLKDNETLSHVSFGGIHSSAVTSEGRVFTWGWNGRGQLGDNTEMDRHRPEDITEQFELFEGERLEEVTLGHEHSTAVTSEGRLFIWGRNAYGQLGDGITYNKLTPTDITHNFDMSEISIKQASLGYFHSSALTDNGHIYTWGWNENSQLGDGTRENAIMPSKISHWYYEPDALKVSPYEEGENIADYTPTKEGYTFDGWYEDKALTIPFDVDTMPANDIRVYGKWIYIGPVI